MPHELGHNFGTHHASALSCTANGVRVSLSANAADCTANEYGDPFTVMGASSKYQPTNYARGNFGWLQAANTQTVTAGGDYLLKPIASYDPTGVGGYGWDELHGRPRRPQADRVVLRRGVRRDRQREPAVARSHRRVAAASSPGADPVGAGRTRTRARVIGRRHPHGRAGEGRRQAPPRPPSLVLIRGLFDRPDPPYAEHSAAAGRGATEVMRRTAGLGGVR